MFKGFERKRFEIRFKEFERKGFEGV